MSYQLSICIPTFNREKYLKELLDCILKQLDDIEENIVEICISDNASTDNTQQMLQQYLKKHNNITYFRWNKNMGADMNYLKVVEIAHGKYCWFFGSDDLMVGGAISRILEEIKEHLDIYLCNTIQCDINMNEKGRNKIFKNNISTRVFKFNSDKDILNYFKSVSAISGLFSYLSGIIFKKEDWDSVKFDNNFIGTAYSHSYILLSLFNKKISLKYIHDFLVMNRGENDSFLTKGIIKRIKLDFDGYKKLFSSIFKHNKGLRNYYKVILKNNNSYLGVANIYSKSNVSEKQTLISFIKDTHNVFIIYFLSFLIRIYRQYFKSINGRK